VLGSLPWLDVTQQVQAKHPASHPRRSEPAIEPNDPTCTGECWEGYQWASDKAINEEALCTEGTEAFKRGCRELVRDEMRIRGSD